MNGFAWVLRSIPVVVRPATGVRAMEWLPCLERWTPVTPSASDGINFLCCIVVYRACRYASSVLLVHLQWVFRAVWGVLLLDPRSCDDYVKQISAVSSEGLWRVGRATVGLLLDLQLVRRAEWTDSVGFKVEECVHPVHPASCHKQSLSWRTHQWFSCWTVKVHIHCSSFQ